MRDDQKTNSKPQTMPAPQLPNIPISPDDPFQSDPDLLPPVKTPSDRDQSDVGQPPGKKPGQAPGSKHPDDFEKNPEDVEAALKID